MSIKNTLNRISIVISIFKIYKWASILLLFLMISSSFFEMIGLGMILPLLEVIINPNNAESASLIILQPILQFFPEYYKLLVLCSMLIIFYLLKNILLILKNGYSYHFIFRYRQLWSNEIMKKYIKADYSYLLSQKQGKLVNNLIIEPEKSAHLLRYFIEFISKIVTCIFLTNLMLIADWKITIFLMIISMFIFIVLRKTTYRYSISVGEKRVALSQDLTSIGAENISGVRQIKTFSVEHQKSKLFAETLKRYLKMLLKFQVLKVLPKPIAESIVIVGIGGGLVYLTYLRQIPINEMLPTIGLIIMVSQKLFPIASELFSDRMKILNYVPSLKLTNDIYHSIIKEEDLNLGKPVRHLEGDIIFKNIGFQYSKSKTLFENLNFVIQNNKVTAIMGSSGEGKSTLVDLLFGLYRPKRGKILVNHMDLEDINLVSWRKLIGYVTQDVFLFNSTIRENILIGNMDATDEEMISAVEKANAKDFIEELPRGYDTVIGDRGLILSGGQRQRIAIARVLIRDPEIIIFDEATSAVDSETEKLIQECIIELSKSKTVIIISHRESTVQNADIIYNLEKGRILEASVADKTRNFIN